MDFIRYINVPTRNINRVYIGQHLLINIAYLTGVVPFRFDYKSGKLIPIESKWQHYHWYGSTTITLLVKVLLILSLIKDIYFQNIRFTYAPDILRMVITSAFTCYGLMDIHTAYKKTELVATLNSGEEFYQRFQCNIIIIFKSLESLVHICRLEVVQYIVCILYRQLLPRAFEQLAPCKRLCGTFVLFLYLIGSWVHRIRLNISN